MVVYNRKIGILLTMMVSWLVPGEAACSVGLYGVDEPDQPLGVCLSSGNSTSDYSWKFDCDGSNDLQQYVYANDDTCVGNFSTEDVSADYNYTCGSCGSFVTYRKYEDCNFNLSSTAWVDVSYATGICSDGDEYACTAETLTITNNCSAGGNGTTYNDTECVFGVFGLDILDCATTTSPSRSPSRSPIQSPTKRPTSGASCLKKIMYYAIGIVGAMVLHFV